MAIKFFYETNHEISVRQYDAGVITDDTIHMLLLIDSIYKSKGKIDGEQYMRYLENWYNENPSASEVIGPSTLNAIKAFENGKKNLAADYAVTNGCMMKIAPIGLLYDNKQDILNAVTQICQYTHNSNVALISAATVAFIIASFSRERNDLEEIDILIKEMEDYSQNVGFDMPSVKISKRIELGNQILERNLDFDTFMREVYEIIGTSIYCTETFPAAVTIVKYFKGDMTKVAQMCTNIGGDTDTIASIACAICGSLGSVPADQEIHYLEKQNKISIEEYVNKIICVL